MIQAKVWWIWHSQFLQSDGLTPAVNQRQLTWTNQKEILPRTEFSGSSDNSQMCPLTWDWCWGLEFRTSHDRQTCSQGCAYWVLHADKRALDSVGSTWRRQLPCSSWVQSTPEQTVVGLSSYKGLWAWKNNVFLFLAMTLCLKWSFLQSVCHHLIFVSDVGWASY